MRTAIQIRGGYENSTDITAAILNDFINEAIAEVWDILKSKRDDRLVTSGIATTTPGVEGVDLSNFTVTNINATNSSFYELRKIEIADPSARSGWRRLRKIDLDVSHLYANLCGKNYRYRMQGAGFITGGGFSADALVLHPTPQVVETLRLYVVPDAPILTNDAQQFNSVNGYEELIYQLVWRRCRDRQEQDLTSVDREIARLTARISSAADGRDVEPFYLSPHGAGGSRGFSDDEDDWWSY